MVASQCVSSLHCGRFADCTIARAGLQGGKQKRLVITNVHRDALCIMVKTCRLPRQPQPNSPPSGRGLQKNGENGQNGERWGKTRENAGNWGEMGETGGGMGENGKKTPIFLLLPLNPTHFLYISQNVLLAISHISPKCENGTTLDNFPISQPHFPSLAIFPSGSFDAFCQPD